MFQSRRPAFSLFVRLQPLAFSLSLFGLLALGSCAPPANNNLSPTIPASPIIRNAPYLLQQDSNQTLHEQLTPETLAYLRKKYGPFVKIGLMTEAESNYLLKGIGGPGQTLTETSLPSQNNAFQIKDVDASACTGTILLDSGEQYRYWNIGRLRDASFFGVNVNFCPQETKQVGFESVAACTGGFPIYNQTQVCKRIPQEGGDFCFETIISYQLVKCCNSSNNFCIEPEPTIPPDEDNCEGKCDDSNGAPFDLLMVHNNLPANGLKPPGDDVQSQLTISPLDQNDIYDSAYLVIKDKDNKGWKLEIFNSNGKLIYAESGMGRNVSGWDDEHQMAMKNGVFLAKLTQTENPGIVLERTIRVDNEKPIIANIRVQEDPGSDRFTIKARLKEAGNGSFQSGVNPALTQIFFDDASRGAGLDSSFDPATGEYSVTFSDLAQYRIAKAQSQQQNGYDFPFELRVSDYAGNEASNRSSGPDGPLRIQVPDPYFSPNGDGVKDTLAFNVIAETSEAYQVAIKRNGVAVKTWTGLTGSQSLSWDGLQNGQALGDGSYRIVAMTEKQRDRVRDAQRVVLDTVGPNIGKLYAQKQSSGVQIQAKVTDSLSGLDGTASPIQVNFLNSTSTGIGTYFGKDYFYELQNPFFQPVPDGTLSYRLSATDRAGNKNTVDGDSSAPSILVEEHGFLDDYSYRLKAEMLDSESDVLPEQAVFDFSHIGLEVTASTTNQLNAKKGKFEVWVTDYVITIPTNSTFSIQQTSSTNTRIQLGVKNVLGIQATVSLPEEAAKILHDTLIPIVEQMGEAIGNGVENVYSTALEVAEVPAKLANGAYKLSKRQVEILLKVQKVNPTAQLQGSAPNILDRLKNAGGNVFTQVYNDITPLVKGIEADISLKDLAAVFVLKYDTPNAQQLQTSSSHILKAMATWALKEAEAIRARGGSARDYDKHMKMFVECVFMQTMTTVIKGEIVLQPPPELFETKRNNYENQLEDTNTEFRISYKNLVVGLEIPPGFVQNVKKTYIKGPGVGGADIHFLDSNNKVIAMKECKSLDKNGQASKRILDALKQIQLIDKVAAKDADYKEIYLQVQNDFDVQKTQKNLGQPNYTNPVKNLINETPQKTNFRLILRTASGEIKYSGTLQAFLGI